MWILLGAEDSGGEGDNWSCKMCSSQNDIYSNTPTPFFYRSDALPVAQVTVSKH